MNTQDSEIGKILVEVDVEELKTMMSGILAERVWRVLPGDTKVDIAKNIARRVEDTLYEKLMKEIETV